MGAFLVPFRCSTQPICATHHTAFPHVVLRGPFALFAGNHFAHASDERATPFIRGLFHTVLGVPRRHLIDVFGKGSLNGRQIVVEEGQHHGFTWDSR